MSIAEEPLEATELRVRGRVQGVGFRPTVWRFARELDLAGEVLNDAEGVLIRISGKRSKMDTFIERLQQKLPPLARIDCVESRPYAGELANEFRIVESTGGTPHTQVAPDAAICEACREEVLSSGTRRHCYAFTNCTHCGPRLSITTDIPYDRAATTMSKFPLCEACRAEYQNPADRRFHAEATACPVCGPALTLARIDGGVLQGETQDVINAARNLLASGEIIAVKGLGGYQLACDATSSNSVERLRRSKKRDRKPFALMARDINVVRRYCSLSAQEERELTSPRAPIVLLRAAGPEYLPGAVAPGLDTLGFMLPTTPLHLLIMQGMTEPLVMTSGNLSDEPQVTEDRDVCTRLGGIASYALMHNRDIANRVDDSVVRVLGGRTRVLRRARGFAPAPVPLPAGFEGAPELLAMGGELKATFCLLKDGQAILSQHQGDLECAATFKDYQKNLSFYSRLFGHRPTALVIDRHPEYLSAKFAREEARRRDLALIEAQHHHAHIAACLAENGYPLCAPPALGIVLDGLGWGDDGTLWGGEFMLANYRRYERLATLKPIAMLGGAQAVREPWRNLYAHILSAMGWEAFATRLAGSELYSYLKGKPRALLDCMIEKGINAPEASSCGRLFDAVAAALGLCRECQAYEGEAAACLEALARTGFSQHPDHKPRPYQVRTSGSANCGLVQIDPAPMWDAILRDLGRGTPAEIIAARFHSGLAEGLVETAKILRGRAATGSRFETVALSGGCFQNKVLFEGVAAALENAGFVVLSHADVPANDGGLSLGQAAIGAARLIDMNETGTLRA